MLAREARRGGILADARRADGERVVKRVADGGKLRNSGGLLSHAAIVAREYGIPGVVGTREATQRIADGVRVRVDGDAGEVTVLA